MHKRILLVDNDPDYRVLACRLLRAKGYEVDEAVSSEMALEKVTRHFYHMFISDIRLRDDRNMMDLSGLDLIDHEDLAHIPKMVISAWQNFDHARRAMKNAVDVVSKDTPKHVVSAVEEVFQKHIRVNWTLEIDSRPGCDLLTLAHHVFPDMPANGLDEAAKELHFLFQGLFKKPSGVLIDRILWQTHRRTAVIVQLFLPERKPTSRLLVIGKDVVLTREREHFRARSYVVAGANTIEGPELFHSCRLSGHTYLAVDGAFEDMVPLSQYMQHTPTDQARGLLDNLFRNTLGPWYGACAPPTQKETLRGWLKDKRQRDAVAAHHVEEALTRTLKAATTLDYGAELTGNSFKISCQGASSHTSNPLLALEEDFPVTLINSPGKLRLCEILSNGRDTWLTNFSGAGWAPQGWDYAVLEAELRYDLANSDTLVEIVALEQKLLGHEARLANPHNARLLDLIETIRQRARENGALSDERVYMASLHYLALQRLQQARKRQSPRETRHYLHCMISAGLLAEKIKKARQIALYVDEHKRLVFLNGSTVKLSAKRFKVFYHLYCRGGKYCSRQELGKLAWPDFDANQKVHITKQNSMISRLREQLEHDSDHPIILTEHEGYRLATDQATAR